MAPKKTKLKKSPIEKEGMKMEKICGSIGPGPKYQLRSVIGYKDHCPTKVKNPAYSFPESKPFIYKSNTPGPVYSFPPPKKQGFSMGLRFSSKTQTTPGPYLVSYPKCPKKPGFTMKFKTKPIIGSQSPGPKYDTRMKPKNAGFTIGLRNLNNKLQPSAGPYDMKFTLTTPRSPAFSIMGRVKPNKLFITPGPSYMPVYKPKPVSMAGKYPPCFVPYFTECDKTC